MPTYIKDTAEELFQQLSDICVSTQTLEVRYAILRNLFYRTVGQALAETQIVFSGLFAKVDYIIKTFNIPSDKAYHIHDTRRILFPQHSRKVNPDDIDLNSSLPYDIQSTAELISATTKALIPAALATTFPTKTRKKQWSKVDKTVIRVIVNKWDDEYIYAIEEENATELKVCYSQANHYLTREGKGDWSYLKQILNESSQLNLVRIRIEDNICFPELIIFEPDFLVNVTTIASCFDESYKETPYLTLINKLKPNGATKYTHLGNLAGQFLDETVHGRNISFDESYETFFHNNALSLTSCEDTSNEEGEYKLKLQAKEQKDNITKLIGNDFPSSANIDIRQAILEPTFFSEVLGLQGRLDFLCETHEGTVIIEQKSGKGTYVPKYDKNYDENTPKAVTKHWVQLILYRALFTYEFNKKADELRHVFLLYSKYKKGLISMAQEPSLLLRAIRMRNLITWCEFSFAKGGARILTRVFNNAFKSPCVKDEFWNTYKIPELQGILYPIQHASPLEQAYFLRFIQFLHQEQLLSKIGNKTKENSGFASKWLETLDDKRSAGNIYDKLTIKDFKTEDNTVNGITLHFSEEYSTDMSNFRIGDIVILYPYKNGSVPDVCGQMVHRASIEDITVDNISLQFRNSQTDKKVFELGTDYLWAIEHDLFDSSNSALYQGLQSFLSAPKERRDLILSQRKPKIDNTTKLLGNYGTFNELVLKSRQARELFLIIGPPGTGKTSFGLLNVLKEELLIPNSNIILLSYTNRAVDEICTKLKEQDIDFIRIGSELSASKEYHDNLLCHRTANLHTTKEVRLLINKTRVFCATTASLNSHIELLTMKTFDLAIVDESSQILEPHLIGLLSAQNTNGIAIRRFILIGDHKQLPAVVQQTPEDSIIKDSLLNDINLTDCRLSLFQRLLTNFRLKDGSYNEDYVYMLTRQGRMHRKIAEFPNKAFYESKLDIVGMPALPHQELEMPKTSNTGNGIRDLLITRPVSFIATPNIEQFLSDKVNQLEADMIASTVKEIYTLEIEHFDLEKTIGIIVPYRNQISTIRNAIDAFSIPMLHNITIDTVERYQGSQRDYIIYGFTIQRRYQLNFLASNVFEENGALIDRKLNVAMTRARLHLIMFGNPSLLCQDITFNALINYTKSIGSFIQVPIKEFVTGNFKVSERKEI